MSSKEHDVNFHVWISTCVKGDSTFLRLLLNLFLFYFGGGTREENKKKLVLHASYFDISLMKCAFPVLCPYYLVLPLTVVYYKLM